MTYGLKEKKRSDCFINRVKKGICGRKSTHMLYSSRSTDTSVKGENKSSGGLRGAEKIKRHQL